jgi:preprotein translocase subunit SecB
MSELPEGVAPSADANPVVQILGQYVKDLSFENPNAPASLQNLANGGQPKTDFNINLNARKLGDEVFEVELKLSIEQTQNDNALFVIELLYGGLFGLRNIPDEALEPFLLVEGPRILFPFAQRIIADVTRDGGYPQMLLPPIDFASLYMQRQTNLPDGVAGNA